MFILRKSFVLEMSHQLQLPYDSQCNRLHGHSYQVMVEAGGKMLNSNGMVCDFADLGYAKILLDHQHLNDFVTPSTAEKLAQYIYQITAEKLDDTSVWLRVFVKETGNTEVLYYE